MKKNSVNRMNDTRVENVHTFYVLFYDTQL